jgi:hypothetical protein
MRKKTAMRKMVVIPGDVPIPSTSRPMMMRGLDGGAGGITASTMRQSSASSCGMCLEEARRYGDDGRHDAPSYSCEELRRP